MRHKLINKIGIGIAILSFLLGTLLLYIFYVFSSNRVIFAGYIFTITAVIINLGVLLVLIFKSIVDKENRKSYLKTSLIMLFNIPIAVGYLYFLIILFNTMRITFINDTDSPLTEIKIISAGQSKINDLRTRGKETVWVDIIGDGNICIEYNIDGRTYREVVCGYVTGGMGTKITHRIGQQKNLLAK